MNTLPWKHNGSSEIVDMMGVHVGYAHNENNAEIISSAVNSLQPFLCIPKMVSEHGLPPPSSMLKALVWYRGNGTPTVSLVPPMRSDDVVAWMPLPLVPHEDAFEKWWKIGRSHVSMKYTILALAVAISGCSDPFETSRDIQERISLQQTHEIPIENKKEAAALFWKIRPECSEYFNPDYVAMERVLAVYGVHKSKEK